MFLPVCSLHFETDRDAKLAVNRKNSEFNFQITFALNILNRSIVRQLWSSLIMVTGLRLSLQTHRK